MYAARAAAVAVLVLLTACSGSKEEAGAPSPRPTPRSPTGTSAPPAGAHPPADWPAYHRDGARSGVAPGTPPVRRLLRSWASRLDGAVYAQPLVVGGVVLVATEYDSLYALDAASGRQRWRVHVGRPVPGSELPCGNIDPLGITGTPVYDAASGRVFAVAEVSGARHLLVAVEVATGRLVLRTPLEAPKGDRRAHQQRAALALAGGRVYVAYGGLYGDCGDYIGSVVSVRTDGTGRLAWAVPTPREGGIWAPGGPVVAPDGTLLVSIGNGESRTSYDGSDSVTRLSPTLRRLDYFAPKQWAEDNRVDADLGSLSPALVGDTVVIAGKSGVGYLLDAARLGGIGGEVAKRELCAAYGAPAVHGGTAYLPCTDGVHAVRAVGLQTRWRAPVDADGPPVVGGGAVYAVDHDSGVLYALDERSGRVRARYDVGSVSRFASPALWNGRVFVPTLAGVVALRIG